MKSLLITLVLFFSLNLSAYAQKCVDVIAAGEEAEYSLTFLTTSSHNQSRAFATAKKLGCQLAGLNLNSLDLTSDEFACQQPASGAFACQGNGFGAETCETNPTSEAEACQPVSRNSDQDFINLCAGLPYLQPDGSLSTLTTANCRYLFDQNKPLSLCKVTAVSKRLQKCLRVRR